MNLLEPLWNVLSIGGKDVGRKSFFYRPRHVVVLNKKARVIEFCVDPEQGGGLEHLVEATMLMAIGINRQKKSEMLKNAISYLNLALNYLEVDKGREERKAEAPAAP